MADNNVLPVEPQIIDTSKELKHPFVIARQGEYGFIPLSFDVSYWLEMFPDASLSMIYRHPSGEVRILKSGIKESPVDWKLTDQDTSAYGYGGIEFYVNYGENSEDALRKSPIVKIRIDKSLSNPVDTPTTEMPDWVEVVISRVELNRDEIALMKTEIEACRDEIDDLLDNMESITVLEVLESWNRITEDAFDI